MEDCRECSKEQLWTKIEKMAGQVKDMKNNIFNLHVPPIDLGLDTCPKLDGNLKPVIAGGEIVMTGGGSTSVRKAIETYQPLLGLHGHIHESKGFLKVGRTLCLNPGSEYSEGSLRGALVELDDGAEEFPAHTRLTNYEPIRERFHRLRRGGTEGSMAQGSKASW